MFSGDTEISHTNGFATDLQYVCNAERYELFNRQ